MRPEDVPDELVEKAARATYDANPLHAMVGPLDVGTLDWERLPAKELAIRLEDARHALAAVLPEIQAQALQDAADEVSGYAQQPGDAPARVMPIEEQRAYMGGANDAHAIVDRLLRDRADRLTATSGETAT